MYIEHKRTCGIDSEGKPRFRTSTGELWNPTGEKICWWDRHKFDGKALPYPTKEDDMAGVWYVSKHERFCSFNCCRSYNRDRQSGNWMYRDVLIVKLAKLCHKTRYRMGEMHVMCAPPIYTLSAFSYDGTGMDIVEFRKGLDQPCTLVELPSPMIASAPKVAVQRPRYTPKPITAERVLLAKQRKAARDAASRKADGVGPSVLEIAMGINLSGSTERGTTEATNPRNPNKRSRKEA